jgi:predicted small metal-binding protein
MNITRKYQEENSMAKVLQCKDVGFQCDGVVRADTEEQVLHMAAEHARTVHGITDLTEEVVEKVRSAIREETV